jgi:hypothetical protein
MGWHYTAPILVRAGAEISREDNHTTETSIPGSSHDWAEKAQIEVFDTNGPQLNAIADHTENHIVVGITGAYEVSAHISMLGGANTVLSFAVFKNNGATQVIPRTSRKVGGSLDVGAASIGGLASLVAGDTIELWVQNETNSANMTAQDVSLFIQKV